VVVHSPGRPHARFEFTKKLLLQRRAPLAKRKDEEGLERIFQSEMHVLGWKTLLLDVNAVTELYKLLGWNERVIR